MVKASRAKQKPISTKNVKSIQEMNFILTAITALINVNKIDRNKGVVDIKQEEKNWPRTRDIAEYCQFSIYKTRHLLIKLSEKGLVQSSSKPISNSLHWNANYHLLTGNIEEVES
ncbi:FaeA/PapI family transcriptional regulator [Providencia burhodogranariea]|uniref:FaeA-like protein n=1 Tax=Providencia burhodogranariea DSM 19968 TaxID=1141662 RepID=K8WPY2_9GAMM|nr:hypothetical protein OOA_08921 [Providencia burhodogranariea DSM 19968]